MALIKPVAITAINLMRYADSINEASDRYVVTNNIRFDEENALIQGMIKIVDTIDKKGYAVTFNDNFMHLYGTSEEQCDAMSLSQFEDCEIERIDSTEEGTALLIKMISALENAGVSDECHPIDYTALVTDPEYPKSFYDTNTDGMLAGQVNISIDGGLSIKGKLSHCSSVYKLLGFKSIVCTAIAAVSRESAESLDDLFDRSIEIVMEGREDRAISKRLMFDYMYEALTSKGFTSEAPYTYNDGDGKGYAFQDELMDVKFVVSQQTDYASLFALKNDKDLFVYKFSTSGNYTFDTLLVNMVGKGIAATEFKKLAVDYAGYPNPSFASHNWLSLAQIKGDLRKKKPELWATKNGQLGDRGFAVELFSMRDAEYLIQSLSRNKVLIKPLIHNPDNLDASSPETWIKDKQEKHGLNRANALYLTLAGLGEQAWINGAMYSLGFVHHLASNPESEPSAHQEDWIVPFQFCMNLELSELVSSNIPKDANESWWNAYWEMLSHLVKSYEHRAESIKSGEIPDSDPSSFIIKHLLDVTDGNSLMNGFKKGLNALSKNLSETSDKFERPVPEQYKHLKNIKV